MKKNYIIVDEDINNILKDSIYISLLRNIDKNDILNLEKSNETEVSEID